jgi:hypothetical protein
MTMTLAAVVAVLILVGGGAAQAAGYEQERRDWPSVSGSIPTPRT